PSARSPCGWSACQNQMVGPALRLSSGDSLPSPFGCRAAVVLSSRGRALQARKSIYTSSPPWLAWAHILALTLTCACHRQTAEQQVSEGIHFAKTHDYDSAITAFESALEKNPELLDGQVQLAKALIAKGRNENALLRLERTLQKSPNLTEAQI